jgi:hypothetical protein
MDTLRIRIPGATDSALRVELWNVVNEFTRKTDVWTETFDLPIVAGQTNYEFAPDNAANVNQLIQIVDNSNLAVKASMPTPGSLVLQLTPSSDATYTVTISLAISDITTRDDFPYLPEWIWDRYNELIINGVQGRMFLQIAKPYSNERLALLHTSRFADEMARARVEARREYTFSSQRWRFPQTYASRRR